MKPVVRDARDHAVVVDEAVVAQQDAVAAPADGEARKVVDIHARQERRGVRPDDLDLAERRGVEDAARRAHRATLARDGQVHALAIPREIARALPLPHVLEHGSVPARPLVSAWCAPGRTDRHGRSPASAPNVTGVYGIRNVVRPTSGSGRARPSATIASAFMFDVLPWSVAMPAVV